MKKILSLVLVVVMLIGCVSLFASCGDSTDSFKIGLIALHDEKSTYDKNFIDALKDAARNVGLSDDQVLIKTNIPESNECYEAAADLVDQGCTLIFADSFGHEEHIIKAAKEFPNVQFCHATGTRAHTEENLPNYHNAFASIYEGRYLAGVAAGMKLNELKSAGKLKGDKPKIGYIGAFTYAEVMSGYTSFYLGAKSVCPDVVMDVTFTGSWFDVPLEKEAANKLISGGCDLISQHADSMGAPSACETAGVPNVAYNVSTVDTCANSFLIASKINWAPYFEYITKTVRDGENNGKIATDWTGTLATGSVQVTDINTKVAAAGTAEKLAQVKAQLEAGTLHVFDINTFTVSGKKLDTYMADVNTDANYTGDTEVVNGGQFEESKYRSAPYFNVEIDGITLLDRNYG